MIIRLAIFVFLCCYATTTKGQTDQYIVKLNGDTLRGKLQINPSRDNSRSMYFKNSDGTKENIRPIRISYVYYDEDYQFRSVAFYNQRVFMRIISENKNLSHYHYTHKRENSIATTNVITKPDGDVLEISALTFRKQIAKFLEDCPEIIAKLDNKEYRFGKQEELYRDYNNCDLQTMVAVSAVQESSDKDGSAAAAGGVAAATTATTTTSTGTTTVPKSEEQDKLNEIDEFRKYVRALDDFDHSRDVLEWLTDVEYRVSQNRDIPNYLWNSLNSMTVGNKELNDRAAKLKDALED